MNYMKTLLRNLNRARQLQMRTEDSIIAYYEPEKPTLASVCYLGFIQLVSNSLSGAFGDLVRLVRV